MFLSIKMAMILSQLDLIIIALITDHHHHLITYLTVAWAAADTLIK